MKNIHVLPTDKPSRLFEIFQFNFVFDNQNMYSEEYKKLHSYKNKNIYITSDEEIKEGDWCLLNNRLVVRYFKPPVESKSFKKIILTTDQGLIKDGVQAIDDEFLEWFVKNPSCEEVEFYNWISFSKKMRYYEPIIQKEESKQETLEEVAERLYSGVYRQFERMLFIKGAKWQQEQILDFLYSEITERRDYSASKMCEKVIEFIEKFNK